MKPIININKLDMYEQSQIKSMISKGISEQKAIEILINSVDGDYSQLSDELRKAV